MLIDKEAYEKYFQFDNLADAGRFDEDDRFMRWNSKACIHNFYDAILLFVHQVHQRGYRMDFSVGIAEEYMTIQIRNGKDLFSHIDLSKPFETISNLSNMACGTQFSPVNIEMTLNEMLMMCGAHSIIVGGRTLAWHHPTHTYTHSPSHSPIAQNDLRLHLRPHMWMVGYSDADLFMNIIDASDWVEHCMNNNPNYNREAICPVRASLSPISDIKTGWRELTKHPNGCINSHMTSDEDKKYYSSLSDKKEEAQPTVDAFFVTKLSKLYGGRHA